MEVLSSSPTSRATRPSRRISSRDIPTPQLVKALIDVAERQGRPIFAAVIAIAATTGLRRGELAGLRWCDIDLHEGKLHVRRSIKNVLDGSGVAGLPKTHQTRGISLDAFFPRGAQEPRRVCGIRVPIRVNPKPNPSRNPADRGTRSVRILKRLTPRRN
jgi:integrase